MMLFAALYQYDDSPSILPYVIVGAILGAIFVLYVRHTQGRSDAMRRLADKRGLKYRTMTLPEEFPRKLLDDLYTGWLIPRWEGPHNVIGGFEGDDLLLAFDIKVHRRKSHYRRTVVARRSASAKPKAGIDRRYLYRTMGDWQIVTRKSSVLSISRLIEPGMIEKQWEKMR
jgi:hypothetical protein